MKNNSINPSSITDSSSEPTSGEIDSINSEIDESSSSYIDQYINEKAIIANLLLLAQDYEDSVTTISNISYDTDYIYLFTSSDEYYFIMTIELDIYDVDEALEMLITSKDHFEVTSIINTFSNSDSPSIDICNIDVFKNDDKYKGYIFKNKINYYIDTEKVIVGLSSIGYKDGNYISLIHIRYDTNNDELVSLPIEGYNSISNNPNSQYHQVIDYLYNK